MARLRWACVILVGQYPNFDFIKQITFLGTSS
jgi:hypothetical protein